MKNYLSILLCLFGLSQISAQPDATIYLNADQSRYTINKNIYGHFAEHLGRCVYDGIYVGRDNQSIPNTDGIRNDIIDALRELKVPILRWPGGCFADTYHWMDGIGPQEDRPTIVNTWWGGVTEDNSFGTHDFLNFCEAIGAEPYLAGNVGSGEVKELSDWVQYVNHDGISPMADLRRENGREEPWNVKYWGVGNEMWGCGGNMTAEYYANVYKQYATFMTDWTNSSKLYRIASGASEDDYHWTEVLMQNIKPSLIEAVALHMYAVIDWNDKGPSYEFSDKQYFQTMQKALRMEELVTRHSTIMDKYDPNKKIGLAVDEWGGWYDGEKDLEPTALYQQNTMRDAMIAGATLNIFNNHADRVIMGNLAQTVNVLQAVILTEGEKMILTPTYHVMKMYNVHQDAQLIPTDIFDMPQYEYEGESLPAISCSASQDASGKIHVSLVNIDASNTHEVNLKMRGVGTLSGKATILTADEVQAHNDFDNPDRISPREFDGFKLKDGNLNVSIPPFSVVVLELK